MTDPIGITGTKLWVRGKDLPASGDIDPWTDHSGQTAGLNRAYAADGPPAPQVAPGSTPNGGKSASFATGAFFQWGYTPFTNGIDYEAWVVVRSSAATNGLWTLGAADDQTGYPYSGQIYETFGVQSGYRVNWAPTLDISAWRLYRVRITTAGVFTAWLDGAQQISQGGKALGWQTQPTIGRAMFRADINSSARFFTGNIAELIMWGRVLTTTETADLITYFNTEHGLSVPGGTPPPATSNLYDTTKQREAYRLTATGLVPASFSTR